MEFWIQLLSSFLVLLLTVVIQWFLEGPLNIPGPVTVAVLGFNVYLYMFPAAPLNEACVNLQNVYSYEEWRRLFLSPLHHVNYLHLCVNMVSFLWKGAALERRLGGGCFLYLLSVFSLLTGLVYMLLQAALTELPLGFIDVSPLINECAVGFSGVLFALKAVFDHYNPGGVTYVLCTCILELVLTYLYFPGTSLIGHLAGILVGLLYTVGPLKTIMKMCAAWEWTRLWRRKAR